jgi:hydrogenase nickel incorporation protein HypA/HybF
MHELGLMQSILDIAEEYARREGASSIREIGLRVGALSGVEPAALEFAFEAARPGTLAQQARLKIDWVPLEAFCPDCGVEFAVDNPFGIALCPSCQQAVAASSRGTELEVSYLEVE